MKLLGVYIGWWLFLAALAVVVTATIFYLDNTVRYPSTATQAKQGCARHGGVRAITDPGETGAYVVCLDGREAFHTKTGRHAR